MSIERISIELTNKCQKACWFCYNHSHLQGETLWRLSELISFVESCAVASVKAVSFGGGEPLQFASWKVLFIELQGLVFRSLTTNGLPLQDKQTYSDLIQAAPNKVHVSIHFPQRWDEVQRVVRQVHSLDRDGIVSGINLLVGSSFVAEAAEAARYIRGAGIDNNRIVYLPIRGGDTPTAQEIARVADGTSFQSMSCLAECGKSPRFCSISWDKKVGWCSYTTSRRMLPELNYQGLLQTLHNLDLRYCGNEKIYALS